MALPLVARSPGKLSLLAADADSSQSTQLSIEAGSSFVVSSDGSKLFAATTDKVVVHSTQAPFQQVGNVSEEGVVLMALSPAGTYLVTCQKPGKTEAGEPKKNLKVWEVSSLSPVFSYSLKTVSKDAWPAVSWAADDSCMAVAVPNAAHVFSAADKFATFTKVTIKGLANLALSPTVGPAGVQLVAGFIPEAKGSPASAGLYDASKPGEPTPRVKKAFFRTQGGKLMWNSTGSALLVLSYADYDVTNQSYYGEQKLHYLPADPAKADAATTVPLPKEGPVHDVQWSPSGDFFLTVAGFMPAKATLWDANCRPIFDFGSGPYNLVRWNPFGRFIALAGFGNLPGDILFFDKLASGTCKQMGATRCPAVSAEWAPDGRHLLIATVAPRLRVDNKVQVLSYTGQLLNTISFDVLFEATWLPAATGTYQHRAPSPERVAAAASSMGPAAGGRGGPAAAPAAKPAGYVPPHLRNGNGVAGNTPAPSFSLGFDPNDRGGKIGSSKPGSGASPVAAARSGSSSAVPGFEFVGDGKAASKNAKRRAKKKQAGDGDGEGGEGGDEAAQDHPAQGVNDAAQAVSSLALDGGADAGGEQDTAKRIRNLQKKLRQIAQLKEKLAKEGEKALEPEQHQKIQSEGSLLAEIQALGGTP